jgi:hypothetical protein
MEYFLLFQLLLLVDGVNQVASAPTSSRPSSQPAPDGSSEYTHYDSTTFSQPGDHSSPSTHDVTTATVGPITTEYSLQFKTTLRAKRSAVKDKPSFTHFRMFEQQQKCDFSKTKATKTVSKPVDIKDFLNRANDYTCFYSLYTATVANRIPQTTTYAELDSWHIDHANACAKKTGADTYEPFEGGLCVPIFDEMTVFMSCKTDSSVFIPVQERKVVAFRCDRRLG